MSEFRYPTNHVQVQGAPSPAHRINLLDERDRALEDYLSHLSTGSASPFTAVIGSSLDTPAALLAAATDVGNGSTDAAMLEACMNRGSGGLILMLPGTIGLERAVQPTLPVRILGSGRKANFDTSGVSVIKGMTNNAALFDLNLAVRTEFVNLSMRGFDGGIGGTGFIAIGNNSNASFIVKESTLYGFDGGLDLSNLTEVRLEDVEFAVDAPSGLTNPGLLLFRIAIVYLRGCQFGGSNNGAATLRLENAGGDHYLSDLFVTGGGVILKSYEECHINQLDVSSGSSCALQFLNGCIDVDVVGGRFSNNSATNATIDLSVGSSVRMPGGTRVINIGTNSTGINLAGSNSLIEGANVVAAGTGKKISITGDWNMVRDCSLVGSSGAAVGGTGVDISGSHNIVEGNDLRVITTPINDTGVSNVTTPNFL